MDRTRTGGCLLFRKRPTTLDILDKLDKDIKSIEQFRLTTEQAQKKIVGQFILVSVGVYVLVAIVFYFYYFPATFYDQVFYIIPLLLVPFIIVLVKRLLTWYYRRKISRNETQLTTLRTEKKKLLEKVMDTETYKVAKEILEKYAPDQLRKSPGPMEVTPYRPASGAQPSNLRLRAGPAKSVTAPAMRTPAVGNLRVPIDKTPVRPDAASTNGQSSLTVVQRSGATPQLPMPRDVLPRDRSVLDKMVEYLVGDGPGNRYALICKSCNSHNGMALREEFEYVAFRCCYCYCFNPARKLRPAAPKLEFNEPRSPQKRRPSQHSTSESEKNSCSETESEHSNGKHSDKEASPDKTPEKEIPVEEVEGTSQDKKDQ